MKVSNFYDGIELAGYISNMPDQYYHTTEGFISKSSLSVLKDSPFKFYNQGKREATKAMQIGTAIHCLVLEPTKFDIEFSLMPEIKDRRQAEYKESAKILGSDHVFVGGDAENLIKMQAAVFSNDAARELLALDGFCEMSGFHADQDSGVNLRHRFDKLTNCGIGIDLKKTQSVHPDEISKTIYKYGYHMQDALYSDAYKAITGDDLKQFYFIFVEEKYPHQVAVVYLDDVSKQVGRDEYKKLLSDYVYYSENPVKTGNNSGIEMVSLPEWALRDYENGLEDGGIF